MRRPGRLIGQLVNPRDERGWMIPRQGTIRRSVYNGLVLGLSLWELSEALEISHDAVEAHVASIQRTDKVNEWRRGAA